MTKKLASKSRDKKVTLVLIVGYLFSLVIDQCEHIYLLNRQIPGTNTLVTTFPILYTPIDG